jgi:tRNA-specific 2-thiouridylase
VEVSDLNWLSESPAPGAEVSVQIRHRGVEVGGRVERIDAELIMIELDGTHRAVTPGQSAAVYSGDELLGGGRIV